MQNTQLLKYIQSIIDDENAMNIMFYSIKKAMSVNGFSLAGIHCIEISEIYQEEPVAINIYNYFADKATSLALLLSIKALILYPNLLKYCEDDRLLFLPYGDRKFGWTVYSTTILNCYKDKEFQCTYDIFESVVFSPIIEDKDIKTLKSFVIEPEKKFLKRYYENLANKKRPNKKVIANNAFVGDENLENYYANSEVEYIGNTAFSYCKNLKTIEIEGEHVLFGLFPIVECESLEGIIVPKGSEDYYKECLPYYKNVIVNSIDEVIHKKSSEETTDDEEDTDYVSDFVRDNSHLKKLKSTVRQTLNLLDEGYNVKEVAEIRELTESTILGHIADMVEWGVMNVDDYVPLKKYNSIIDAYNETNGEDATLTEIKQASEENVSYMEIKLVLADIQRLSRIKEEDKEDSTELMVPVEEPENNEEETAVIEEPEELELDTEKLYTVFKSKVTSYKYFWLLAIVGLVNGKGLLAYSYRELLVRMVSEAWPLIMKYELDLGKQDKMSAVIAKIKSKAVVSDTDAKSVELQIMAQYDRCNLEPCLLQLIKNVPYRFLSPWIKYTNDEDVKEKSNMTENCTPYGLSDNGIVIDEDWFDYFVENYDKIVEFVQEELGKYLNGNNTQFKMIKYKLHNFKR